MKRFALIGAAGFVAPKHMKAIKDVGGDLVAAMDPHDSVGVLDKFFPECRYFSAWEPFDWFCSVNEIEYVSICSPNYLHKDHCWFASRIGATAICEKPLALTINNLRTLETLVSPTNGIYTILQLRLNPAIQEVREKYRRTPVKRITVEYHTPRGRWYERTWKADATKSGGLATNIGIHLFDLITWIFGRATSIHRIKTVGPFGEDQSRICGVLSLERAQEVFFNLSIDPNEIPRREISINNEPPIPLSQGFAELHTESYRRVLEGNGFGIEEVYPSLEICEALR